MTKHKKEDISNILPFTVKGLRMTINSTQITLFHNSAIADK